MTRCVAVVWLPLPSLKVHVTRLVPSVVIGNLVVVVPVTVPTQASVVVGAVGVAGVPLHVLNVTSANVGVTGGIVSSTITFWFAVVTLPWPSSKAQVTTVVP